MAVIIVTCSVCSNNEDVKYKCPICREPYCSVKCCREHKEKNCSVERQSISPNEGNEPISVATSRPAYNYESEDTVPIARLELLRESTRLKQMLENPHLRRILEAMDRSGDAAQLILDAMKEPIFIELADECLRVIGEKSDGESDDDCS